MRSIKSDNTMNKIQVTAQQRANAIEARDVMWPSVPEANVVPRLKDWRRGPQDQWQDGGQRPDCGTVACFGGWAEWWPSFRPAVLAYGDCSWNGVCALFADPTQLCIVSIRGGFPSDHGFEGTDHALVLNRLNWLIENSEVIG